MKRREFITLLGGAAAAWPLAARAQQPAMPVIGFLRPSTPESVVHLLAAFRAGLKEIGFIEGQNVAIEYRWAYGQEDRLGEIAAELVRRQMAVIVAPGSTLAALAAKAHTTTIPVVFASGIDPVRAGLVARLNRPGGNVTGIHELSGDLVAKRLGLLHELAPAVTTIAVLVNPGNAIVAESTAKEAQAAARSLGLEIKVFPTRSSRDIDTAFIDIMHQRIGAVLVKPRCILHQPPCSTCNVGNSICHSSNFSDTRVRRSWRAHVLRHELRGRMAQSRRLCRSRSQGREGSAGRADRQV
jgi:putative tryptophan/tyrosine transport system substrate-binding protein